MIQKYGAALISIALVAFAFLQTALAGDDRLDPAEGWQLAALVAGAIATFVLPLAPVRWAGALKTGSAAIAALAAAIVPFALDGRLTLQQAVVVGLAVLNALGVELGVQARTSALRATAAPPAVIAQSLGEFAQILAPTPNAATLDPEGAKRVLAT